MITKSPVTKSDNVVLEKEILSSFVIEKYKKELNIDVSKFFHSIDKIYRYKCMDTGYRFYYPLNITGDNYFYQELGKLPWYYMNWKWEHEVASGFIKKNDKVLEIGCARGSFLKKIKENGAIAEGLEMNSKAMAECAKNGFSVYSDTIEKFSIDKANNYDVVCSFQVLEHLADVRSFLESSLFVLKPGGLMVVSVPNNDCLMFKSNDVILNMPPHHMGLWNINSLIKLQKYFNMKIESIHLEPLQKYHIGFANKIARKEIKRKLEEKIGIFSPIIEKIARRFAFLGVSSVSEYIIGHSILAIFRKNND